MTIIIPNLPAATESTSHSLAERHAAYGQYMADPPHGDLWNLTRSQEGDRTNAELIEAYEASAANAAWESGLSTPAAQLPYSTAVAVGLLAGRLRALGAQPLTTVVYTAEEPTKLRYPAQEYAKRFPDYSSMFGLTDVLSAICDAATATDTPYRVEADISRVLFMPVANNEDQRPALAAALRSTIEAAMSVMNGCDAGLTPSHMPTEWLRHHLSLAIRGALGELVSDHTVGTINLTKKADPEVQQIAIAVSVNDWSRIATELMAALKIEIGNPQSFPVVPVLFTYQGGVLENSVRSLLCYSFDADEDFGMFSSSLYLLNRMLQERNGPGIVEWHDGLNNAFPAPKGSHGTSWKGKRTHAMLLSAMRLFVVRFVLFCASIHDDAKHTDGLANLWNLAMVTRPDTTTSVQQELFCNVSKFLNSNTAVRMAIFEALRTIPILQLADCPEGHVYTATEALAHIAAKSGERIPPSAFLGHSWNLLYLAALGSFDKQPCVTPFCASLIERLGMRCVATSVTTHRAYAISVATREFLDVQCGALMDLPGTLGTEPNATQRTTTLDHKSYLAGEVVVDDVRIKGQTPNPNFTDGRVFPKDAKVEEVVKQNRDDGTQSSQAFQFGAQVECTINAMHAVATLLASGNKNPELVGSWWNRMGVPVDLSNGYLYLSLCDGKYDDGGLPGGSRVTMLNDCNAGIISREVAKISFCYHTNVLYASPMLAACVNTLVQELLDMEDHSEVTKARLVTGFLNEAMQFRKRAMDRADRLFTNDDCKTVVQSALNCSFLGLETAVRKADGKFWTEFIDKQYLKRLGRRSKKRPRGTDSPSTSADADTAATSATSAGGDVFVPLQAGHQ